MMGPSGRGSLKRKAAGFQKSHTPWNKGSVYQHNNETARSPQNQKTIKRLTYQEFDRTFTHTGEGKIVPHIEKLGLVSSPAEHSPGGFLRPKVAEESEVERTLKQRKEEEISGYIDLHLPTTVSVIQDCIIEHSKTSSGCTGRLVTSANLVTKWGLSATIKLKCNFCSFVSSKHKVFREVSRAGPGRRHAEPYRALAVGLLSTSIGVAGSKRLFASMGKVIPADSAMQRQINSVGDKICALNATDMNLQRAELKNTLQHAGYSRDLPIPAEGDRQYNNSLQSGRRRTPYAPATQTRDVLVENLTPSKKNHSLQLRKQTV